MKIMWELFTDVWHLAREYEFRKLTDAEWEQFKACGEELLEKYRKHGADVEMLYRDLFRAVQAYYERRNHEKTESNM